MGARARQLAGLVLVLGGLAVAAVLLRLVLRAGLPEAVEGAKGAANLWLLTLGAALPATAGVAVGRGWPSGPRFAGWWLVGLGALALGTLGWVGPAYRDWPESLAVGSALCVLPPVAAGLLLLRWGRSGGRPGR